MKTIPCERYQLLLRHDYRDGDGNWHEMDRPLINDVMIASDDNLRICSTAPILEKLFSETLFYLLEKKSSTGG